jgi:hypothetical protein
MTKDNSWITDENIYEQVWRKALTAFGWPNERIEWFVAQYADDLKTHDSLFYHEDPAYYLTFELLPNSACEEIKRRVNGQASGWPWELYHPIHEMLNTALKWYENIFSGRAPEIPDWIKLKAEIEAFLAHHQERLRYP